ncbi:MAG: anaerobic ribonucleoside-triphosphate reductase activating protein [Bacteroidales bacterium]|jgi:anaerobic ribonucleoside-triphosphate reductase activating protein|nr:anaerobic ribonucleoside-triphosphate reductase activating protein [Bacteroidales bacterium]
MIKYIPELTDIVLEEIPDRVTLAVEISNCRGSCPGCHSPFLKLDLGEELTPEAVDRLIADNFGVDCFLLLGEGNDLQALLGIAEHLRRHHPEIRRAVYSGRPQVEPEVYAAFDYVKVGPYVEELGPLNKPTTNQRLYYHGEDITFRFWHRGLEKDRKD